MALYYYDNELNQKYNINKELKMTQTVKDLIAVAVAMLEIADNSELSEAVAKLEALGDNAKGDTQEYKDLKALVDAVRTEAQAKVDEAEQEDEMNILEALIEAERTGKVARRGWAKELNSSFMTIPRGQTKPVLSNGKHSSPYTPSIVDVMATDWYLKEEV